MVIICCYVYCSRCKLVAYRYWLLRQIVRRHLLGFPFKIGDHQPEQVECWDQHMVNQKGYVPTGTPVYQNSECKSEYCKGRFAERSTMKDFIFMARFLDFTALKNQMRSLIRRTLVHLITVENTLWQQQRDCIGNR